MIIMHFWGLLILICQNLNIILQEKHTFALIIIFPPPRNANKCKPGVNKYVLEPDIK